jgi:hypothetical protein
LKSRFEFIRFLPTYKQLFDQRLTKEALLLSVYGKSVSFIEKLLNDNYFPCSDYKESLQNNNITLKTVISTKKLSKEQITGFTCLFTIDEQKRLSDGLTNAGYLPKETIYSHFCHVLGSTGHGQKQKAI